MELIQKLKENSNKGRYTDASINYFAYLVYCYHRRIAMKKPDVEMSYTNIIQYNAFSQTVTHQQIAMEILDNNDADYFERFFSYHDLCDVVNQVTLFMDRKIKQQPKNRGNKRVFYHWLYGMLSDIKGTLKLKKQHGEKPIQDFSTESPYIQVEGDKVPIPTLAMEATYSICPARGQCHFVQKPMKRADGRKFVTIEIRNNPYRYSEKGQGYAPMLDNLNWAERPSNEELQIQRILWG